jgi:hypothetical protein
LSIKYPIAVDPSDFVGIDPRLSANTRVFEARRNLELAAISRAAPEAKLRNLNACLQFGHFQIAGRVTFRRDFGLEFGIHAQERW